MIRRRAKSLSHNPCGAEGDEGAGEVEHGQVIVALLLPANEQASKSVEPRMRALDHPAPGSVAGNLLSWLALDSAGRNVRGVSPEIHQVANVRVVVALVHAQVLLGPRRPRGHQVVEGSADQFLVMPIGAVDRQRQGHAGAVGERGTLGAALAPVGRVFPGFFPRPAGPWSSRCPSPATPTGCPSIGHTPAAPPSTVCGTRRASPTAEIVGAACCPSRTHAARPSTGIRSATHKRCHRQSVDSTPTAGRPWDVFATAAAAAPSAPTPPQATAIVVPQNCSGPSFDLLI